jgi:hypothetical protein
MYLLVCRSASPRSGDKRAASPAKPSASPAKRSASPAKLSASPDRGRELDRGRERPSQENGHAEDRRPPEVRIQAVMCLFIHEILSFHRADFFVFKSTAGPYVSRLKRRLSRLPFAVAACYQASICLASFVTVPARSQEMFTSYASSNAVASYVARLNFCTGNRSVPPVFKALQTSAPCAGQEASR